MGTTRVDWNRIEELFNAALEQPFERRLSFLEKSPETDSRVLNEVRSLLQSYDEDPEFLETPAARLTGKEYQEEEENIVGERVGAYTITRKIGRGGMGSVWLAERADNEFNQQVAIKIVKRGMDSEEIIRRFRAERQILASLQHPNIARLVDGGIALDGRPWLAMEYVQGGIPLNRYCDLHQLPLSKRLSLFRIVCSAVVYAHSNLIVHRDLKMTNILVSNEGEVKLLDFGIAKLLSPDSTEEDVTQTNGYLLTPDYASPEQIRGESVTTSTDVYSLGVLLYELLSGSRPYRLRGLSTAEIRARLDHAHPLPPDLAAQHGNEKTTVEEIARNRKTTPARLAKELRGELKIIVAAAMQKEARRRYQSVEQLVDDIDRYVQGLPLRARPDSLSYLVGKFISRHKFGVTALGTIFTSVAGFGVAMRGQRNRIAEQAEQIGRERDKAEQITRFLKSLFSSNDPSRSKGRELTALEVLEQGLQRVEGELKDRPDLQVDILLMIGEVYLEMGAYDRSESVFRRSIQIAREHLSDNSPQIAASLHALGATINCRDGDSNEVLQLFGEAFTILKRIYEEDGKEDSDGDIPHILNDIGLILNQQGKASEAEQIFRIVNNMRLQIFKGDHHHIAYTLSNLSIVLQRQGPERFAEAASVLGESVEMLHRLNGEIHPDTAMGFYNLARLYERLGRTEESDRLHLKTLAIRQKLFKQHRALANSYIRAGAIHSRQGAFDQAEDYLEKGLEMARKIQGGDHPDVANALIATGQHRQREGRLDEAETLYHKAREILHTQPSATHTSVASVAFLLGTVAEDRGDREKAEQLYRESLALYKATSWSHGWTEELCKIALADLLTEEGDVVEATDLLESTLRTREVRGDCRTDEIIERLEKLGQQSTSSLKDPLPLTVGSREGERVDR
ncbi:MAG: serine/threonine protein kinase [Ignavibacteriae bacterium]|nr:serine/threonine protein kinase [Ignavibacteriota bacterium]MCB9217678.1 serine/threonine protein kinase [Ignavibacteria bacterium]